MLSTTPRGLPVMGFAAYSGTGKTTLLLGLIPRLRAAGLRLAVIKHAHHSLEVDQPGKDSFELRHAGSEQTIVASRYRTVVVREGREREPDLGLLLREVDEGHADLVLVEGFKHAPIPKIELHRPALGYPLLFPRDPHVVAVASDAPLTVPCPLPILELGNSGAVAAFLIEHLSTRNGSACSKLHPAVQPPLAQECS